MIVVYTIRSSSGVGLSVCLSVCLCVQGHIKLSDFGLCTGLKMAHRTDYYKEFKSIDPGECGVCGSVWECVCVRTSVCVGVWECMSVYLAVV